MLENGKLQDNKLEEQDLEKVSGGIIHPVFMWQCDDCKNYLGKNYKDNTCSFCGSNNLHYVRLM